MTSRHSFVLSYYYLWNMNIELMRTWTSGGILLFFTVEKIVRRYEELSSHGGQRALGHTHHHHQKRKDKKKSLEGPEKNAAVEKVAAPEGKESKSFESKSSDLIKVLSDSPEIQPKVNKWLVWVKQCLKANHVWWWHHLAVPHIVLLLRNVKAAAYSTAVFVPL